MYRLVRSLKNPVSCRYLSITNNTNNIKREARFMMKLLKTSNINALSLNKNETSESKIRAQRNNYVMPNVTGTMNITRRMQVLNTIYMKRITEILSVGLVDPTLLDRGIEITGVQISYDLTYMKVLWNCRQEDPEIVAEIASMLDAAAPLLKHQLAEQRITSKVPTIKFVQDTRAMYLLEIERRLKIADFGEPVEIVPSPVLECDDTQPNSVTKCQKLDMIDKSEIDTLPKMRNDIFGLDHYAVMSKIKTSLVKSKQVAERSPNVESAGTTNGALPDLAEIMSQKEENELFQKFLIKRRVEEKEKCKNLRKSAVSRYNDDDSEEYEDESEDYDSEEDYDDSDDGEEDYLERDDDDIYHDPQTYNKLNNDQMNLDKNTKYT